MEKVKPKDEGVTYLAVVTVEVVDGYNVWKEEKWHLSLFLSEEPGKMVGD